MSPLATCQVDAKMETPTTKQIPANTARWLPFAVVRAVAENSARDDKRDALLAALGDVGPPAAAVSSSSSQPRRPAARPAAPAAASSPAAAKQARRTARPAAAVPALGDGVVVGANVRRFYPGYGYYNGTVAAVGGASVEVAFEFDEDGSAEWPRREAAKAVVLYDKEIGSKKVGGCVAVCQGEVEMADFGLWRGVDLADSAVC